MTLERNITEQNPERTKSIDEVTFMCINQFMRPKYHFQMEGVGDCRTCQPDYKNKECKAYYPIPVRQFNVYEK